MHRTSRCRESPLRREPRRVFAARDTVRREVRSVPAPLDGVGSGEIRRGRGQNGQLSCLRSQSMISAARRIASELVQHLDEGVDSD